MQYNKSANCDNSIKIRGPLFQGCESFNGNVFLRYHLGAVALLTSIVCKFASDVRRKINSGARKGDLRPLLAMVLRRMEACDRRSSANGTVECKDKVDALQKQLATSNQNAQALSESQGLFSSELLFAFFF